jgi:hypothetical protein
MREDADVDCSDLKAPAFGKQNLVAIAKGSHLFPSRTQKLSPSALKILGGRLPGKRGRCQFCFPFFRDLERDLFLLLLSIYPADHPLR